ncbi:hypothetical protein CAOG_06734 [Capsaspora owczarzaki ATCC 30864]|nr:hypothetical protein CAOG_06734 [Capsaspora owczarzaki ATCC 30864]|eukprot:XP_004344355.2 hypothetical protein CAOG_06734 [Capsaspora owczarzaki ATCC 30864]
MPVAELPPSSSTFKLAEEHCNPLFEDPEADSQQQKVFTLTADGKSFVGTDPSSTAATSTLGVDLPPTASESSKSSLATPSSSSGGFFSSIAKRLFSSSSSSSTSSTASEEQASGASAQEEPSSVENLNAEVKADTLANLSPTAHEASDLTSVIAPSASPTNEDSTDTSIASRSSSASSKSDKLYDLAEFLAADISIPASADRSPATRGSDTPIPGKTNSLLSKQPAPSLRERPVAKPRRRAPAPPTLTLSKTELPPALPPRTSSLHPCAEVIEQEAVPLPSPIPVPVRVPVNIATYRAKLVRGVAIQQAVIVPPLSENLLSALEHVADGSLSSSMSSTTTSNSSSSSATGSLRNAPLTASTSSLAERARLADRDEILSVHSSDVEEDGTGDNDSTWLELSEDSDDDDDEVRSASDAAICSDDDAQSEMDAEDYQEAVSHAPDMQYVQPASPQIPKQVRFVSACFEIADGAEVQFADDDDNDTREAAHQDATVARLDEMNAEASNMVEALATIDAVLLSATGASLLMEDETVGNGNGVPSHASERALTLEDVQDWVCTDGDFGPQLLAAEATLARQNDTIETLTKVLAAVTAREGKQRALNDLLRAHSAKLQQLVDLQTEAIEMAEQEIIQTLLAENQALKAAGRSLEATDEQTDEQSEDDYVMPCIDDDCTADTDDAASQDHQQQAHMEATLPKREDEDDDDAQFSSACSTPNVCTMHAAASPVIIVQGSNSPNSSNISMSSGSSHNSTSHSDLCTSSSGDSDTSTSSSDSYSRATKRSRECHLCSNLSTISQVDQVAETVIDLQTQLAALVASNAQLTEQLRLDPVRVDVSLTLQQAIHGLAEKLRECHEDMDRVHRENISMSCKLQLLTNVELPATRQATLSMNMASRLREMRQRLVLRRATPVTSDK